MRKLIKLNKSYDIKYNANIIEYLDPDNIFIPIKNNYELLVKNNNSVLKGQIVLENNLNKIISPISGYYKDISIKNIDGINQKCMCIINDFKEKSKSIKINNKKIDKDYIISKLYEYYFKYIASILETKKINYLIISGIEDEPYIMNNVYILNKYSKEILELTDVLSTAFNINNSCIAIKSNDTKNVEKYLSKIGTYPNISISLVEDKYLLGKPFFLLEELGLNDMDSLVLSAKEILEMYDAIILNKHTFETFVTICGPNISKSGVYKVKIGTVFEDLFKKYYKKISENEIIVLNGLMTGNTCNISNTIITKNTLGIIVIPKINEIDRKCDNCGLCYKICPVKINPKNAMDRNVKSANCLDCGLCSYICPKNINLRKYLKGENE